MSKTPAPTAKEINEAHQFAKECAETAIEWAVKCGQLLAKKKVELGHGKFEAWVGQWCEFSARSARVYIQASVKHKQIGSALPISSIRQVLEADKPKEKKPNSPKGAVPVVNPQGTGETGNVRPAAPITAEPAATVSPPPSAGEPEWTAEDEAALHAEQDAESRATVEAALKADDKFAALAEENKRLVGENLVLKRSRDHYQNQAGEAVRLLKKEQAKVAKLEKELASFRKKAA